jgi:hypothetical protein
MDQEPLLSISEERSITIHGLYNHKSSCITFSDDEVTIHISDNRPDIILPYRQLRSCTPWKTSWQLKYLDSSHEKQIFNFIPDDPITPKYCTRLMRKFVADIIHRNNNL